MWKPPERIRHDLLEDDWPTRETAAASKLFSPLERGRLRLARRTWVPAMVPWRATEDGLVTDDVVDWYRRFAAGLPGALVVEATGIRDIPSGPLLRAGHDRFVPGLRRIVDAVREESGGATRLFLQIIDFLTIRRRPEPATFFARYLRVEDRHRAALERLGVEPPDGEQGVRDALATLDDAQLEEILDDRELESLRMGYRERVTDVHLPHVAQLPRTLPGLFASAARRAEEAGFDGVELHFAHAYTMASFLSALNTRTDGYGGGLDGTDLEGRVRLPLEVFAAVRSAVGDDFVVGARFLSEDCLDGGSSVDDVSYFARRFAEAGMDFLSLSRGGKFEDAKQPRIGRAAYPYTGPSGYECMPTAISDDFGPFGRNVRPTRRVRDAVRAAGFDTPVVLAGGMSTFAQAEAHLRNGDADVIAAARQTLADPDWFLKMERGEGTSIRRCIFTNYCEGLDQMHKQVTCQLWDREDLGAPDVTRSKDGKRRLVAPDWDLGQPG